jgi:hypothetical protein
MTVPTLTNVRHPNREKIVLKTGDICTFQQESGVWEFFWVLAIDKEKTGDIFSLSKFSVQSETEISIDDIADIEELKIFNRLGHFPIASEQVDKANPKVIGFMQVTESDLDGYRIWREAFDKGEAGVFTVPLESI